MRAINHCLCVLGFFIVVGCAPRPQQGIVGRWTVSGTGEVLELSKDSAARITSGGNTATGSYRMGASNVLIVTFPSTTPSVQTKVRKFHIRAQDWASRTLWWPYASGTVAVPGRLIKTTADQPATIETQGDDATITFGNHKVRVEKERLLLDDTVVAKMPASATNVTVVIFDATLTVTADSSNIITIPTFARVRVVPTFTITTNDVDQSNIMLYRQKGDRVLVKFALTDTGTKRLEEFFQTHTIGQEVRYQIGSFEHVFKLYDRNSFAMQGFSGLSKSESKALEDGLRGRK